MQVDRSASRPNHNWSNKKTAKTPNNASQPYVPLPGVWLPGSHLPCRWVLQSVANCFRRPPTIETVADCSQTVAIGCKPRKSADSVSRRVCAIPFLDEGAIRQNRWTRIHSRAAEKQGRT